MRFFHESESEAAIVGYNITSFQIKKNNKISNFLIYKSKWN